MAATQKKPLSLKEATEAARASIQPMTEEDRRALKFGDTPEDVDDDPPEAEAEAPAANPGTPPEWADVPTNLVFPTSGKRVYYMRFPSDWTEDGQEHQCVLWGLTYNDEKLALVRCKAEPMRTVAEHARQMLRAVDGAKANWTMRPSNVDTFWEDIGSRCRSMIVNHYLSTHSFTQEEKVRFFTECFASTASR